MQALGPAVLPFGCGLILILLGSVLFLQGKRQDKQKTSEFLVPLIPHGVALKRVAFSLGALLLAATFFQSLGYILTVFCLVVFLMRTNEVQRWRSVIFYSLLFTLGSYLLFQVLLKTMLPIGFLGF
jgi:amino acid transporter